MAEITPPFFMQTGAHPAQAFRRPLEAVFRYGGVVGPGDLLVAPTASTREVTVAAGDVIVVGTENAVRQGAYGCTNDATVTLPVTVADATNPRYDRIVAQVRDGEFSGANSDWLLAVIPGTPVAVLTPAAEPALPANCTELARLTVGAGATSFVAGNLVDRRPLARSGSLLAIGSLTANGTNAAGLHDSGLAVTFVMPALASGQRVEVEASGNSLFWASNVTTVASYAILRDAANVQRGSGFAWSPGFATQSGSFPPARAELTNTDYAAGTLVTMKLATDSPSGVAHVAAATTASPVHLTAKLV